MASWEDVAAIASALPEVAEEPSYGNRAWKVRRQALRLGAAAAEERNRGARRVRARGRGADRRDPRRPGRRRGGQAGARLERAGDLLHDPPLRRLPRASCPPRPDPPRRARGAILEAWSGAETRRRRATSTGGGDIRSEPPRSSCEGPAAADLDGCLGAGSGGAGPASSRASRQVSRRPPSGSISFSRSERTPSAKVSTGTSAKIGLSSWARCRL